MNSQEQSREFPNPEDTKKDALLGSRWLMIRPVAPTCVVYMLLLYVLSLYCVLLCYVLFTVCSVLLLIVLASYTKTSGVPICT